MLFALISQWDIGNIATKISSILEGVHNAVMSDKLVVISRHVLLTTGTFEEDVGRASNSE